MWAFGDATPEPVPPTAFYHGFTTLRGFPYTFNPLNDPNSCPTTGNRIQIRGLAEGTEGILFDGSPDRDYNPYLHCKWYLQAAQPLVRWMIFVNFFDLEPSPNCANDRLELREGNEAINAMNGIFCGSISSGTPILSVLKREIMIDFITDHLIERSGFNITYKVFPLRVDDPPGLLKSMGEIN